MENSPEIYTFEIENGMDVYLATGQKIGSVMEIAGFGSTKIPRVSPQSRVAGS